MNIRFSYPLFAATLREGVKENSTFKGYVPTVGANWFAGYFYTKACLLTDYFYTKDNLLAGYFYTKDNFLAGYFYAKANLLAGYFYTKANIY